MPSFEYDLRYLQAGLDQLESYLLSKDLYWSIGIGASAGETPYPQLTPAGLLLAVQRLRARELLSAEKNAFDVVERRLNEILSRWRAAWGKKAAVDFRARLKLWRDFLEEYRANPETNYNRYTYEVGRRVQLQLLLPEAEAIPPAELQMLDGLDSLLRAVFTPGEFIWEAYLAAVFPDPVYWYLYGQVRKTLG